MKKIVVCVILFSLIFILVSCDPGAYYYDYDDLMQNVISVELIGYVNPNQKSFFSWVPDHSSDLVALKMENMSVLETLEEEKVDPLLQQLSKAHILRTYYAFDSPKGICIKLNHKNNDFDIISADIKNKSYAGYIGRFTSDGNVKEFTGSFASYNDFENLVNDYFETKI